MAAKVTPVKLRETVSSYINRATAHGGKRPTHLALSREQWKVVIEQTRRRYPVFQVWQDEHGRLIHSGVVIHRAGTPPDGQAEVTMNQKTARRW